MASRSARRRRELGCGIAAASAAGLAQRAREHVQSRRKRLEPVDPKLSVEITEGRITHFYAMRNPDKLAGIAIPRTLSR